MFRGRGGGSAPGDATRSSARFVERVGREAVIFAYLSDTIARVVISGFSPALLVTSATATARSAAVSALLVRAGSVLQLQHAKLQGWVILGGNGRRDIQGAARQESRQDCDPYLLQ